MRSLFRTVLIGVSIGLILFGLGLPANANSETTLGINIGLDDGSCFSGGEYVSTEAISVELGHTSDNFNADAYLRDTPTGGDCGVNGLSVLAEASYQTPINELFHGFVGIGTSQIAVAQPYEQDGRFAYLVDATPANSALFGIGATVGDFTFRIAANVVNTDWVMESSRAADVSLGYERSILGGDLSLGIGCLCGESQLVNTEASWSQGVLQVSWRRNSGLTELASPFPLMHPSLGWYQSAGPADVVESFEVGVTFPL